MSERAPAKAAAALAPRPGGAGLLQRQCECGAHAPGGECEGCKQRRLQRKPQGGSGGTVAPPLVNRILGSPGGALDPGARAFLEPRFGRDFSQVRVHADAEAGRSAREVGALAYTVGQHIVFAPGQYDPRGSRGRRLLAHELAHTIQQAGVAGVGQAKLEIDPGGSPAEAAADQAAEAVMAGRPLPTLAGLGATLSRQADGQPIRDTQVVTGPCHGNPSAADLTDVSRSTPPWQDPPTPMSVRQIDRVSDDERRVTLATGQRYRVRRTRWTETATTGDASPHATPGLDRSQAWVEISWCEGSQSEGRIRVGANVPEQVIQLLVRTLSNGGDVAAAWQQATITPQASGDFRIGSWRVTPSAQVTVDSNGRVVGGQGGLGASRDTGGGNVGVHVQAGSDPTTGPQVSITFTISGSEPPRPPCVRRTTRSGMRYECVQEVDVQEQTRPGTRTTATNERHVHNLFFRYAVPQFDDPRNAEGLSGITTDLGAGFQVQRIEGFASPEGPQAARGTFMGNEELSRQRAEAARTRVEGLCTTGACFAADVAVVGLGERLDPRDDQGQPQDASGAPLEQHVDQTFPTDPGEAPVRTQPVMDRLARTRGAHRRAEQIYPLLRRAEITLTRTQTGSGTCTYTIPAHTADTIAGSCPPGLVSAAFPAGPSGTSRTSP